MGSSKEQERGQKVRKSTPDHSLTDQGLLEKLGNQALEASE